MSSKIAESIRQARLAVRLTQEQLGGRLGLRGRAVSRWEGGHSEPSKRNRRALVQAIQAYDANAAAKLDAFFTQELGDPTAFARAKPPTPSKKTQTEAFELAVHRMADALDLPARRLRRPLLRLLKQWRTAGLSLDAAQDLIKEWINTER